MSIKNLYNVQPIDSFQCNEWLIYKHYAGRVPQIMYSFGLFKDGIINGVCTFGLPPRVMNNGEAVFRKYRVLTLELNRLVINEGLEKNVLSFFVSKCIDRLPKPCCLVSYADFTFGHNGYIYQATNWIYTGLNQVHEREWFLNGEEIHQRTLSGYDLTSAAKKKEAGLVPGEYTKKHRYFKFLGSKTDIKHMAADFVYPIIKQYPKGNNKRYDSSYKPQIQTKLF